MRQGPHTRTVFRKQLENSGRSEIQVTFGSKNGSDPQRIVQSFDILYLIYLKVKKISFLFEKGYGTWSLWSYKPNDNIKRDHIIKPLQLYCTTKYNTYLSFKVCKFDWGIFFRRNSENICIMQSHDKRFETWSWTNISVSVIVSIFINRFNSGKKIHSVKNVWSWHRGVRGTWV